jgi:hypothetical protein
MKSNNSCKIFPLRQTKIFNEIAPYQTKTIQPMHKKIYESSLQESRFIKKVDIPETHPSYIKNDGSIHQDMYTLYNSNKSVVIGQVPMRKIKVQPMTKKIYEGTVQKSKFISKVPIPESHKSYDKQDYSYKVPNTPSFNKKVDLFRTTYNFLKP